MFDYPRYANKRRELKMTRRGRHPMVRLFTSAAPALFDFLKSTRLAFRPEKGVALRVIYPLTPDDQPSGEAYGSQPWNSSKPRG